MLQKDPTIQPPPNNFHPCEMSLSVHTIHSVVLYANKWYSNALDIGVLFGLEMLAHASSPPRSIAGARKTSCPVSSFCFHIRSQVQGVSTMRDHSLLDTYQANEMSSGMTLNPQKASC